MASLQHIYEPIARNAARAAGIDPDLFVRQISQESGWQDDVVHCRRVSSAGAQGVAQIVARFHPGVNPCDPVAALEYAAGLMRSHLATWDGDYALALSSYNAGPGATRDGLNGNIPGWPYAETVAYVANILQVPADEARHRLTKRAPARVTYNAATPAIPQNDAWSCAPTSARWGLIAVGRAPTEAWIESTMLAEGVVSQAEGLLDATGAGLAAFLNRHYGEFGYRSTNEPLATFEALRAESGRYPLMIGGRAWGHWSGLRGYDQARDVLLLANPANGWGGVEQTMNRSQFVNLGPFSLVRLTHPDLLTQPTPTPTPTPPPADPRDARIAQLEREKAELVSTLGYVTKDVSAALQAAVDTLKRHAP